MRDALELWQPTLTFVRHVQRLRVANGPAGMFGNGGNWLRDAKHAANFAQRARASHVRLVPRPLDASDFEVKLRLRDRALQFEATEVQVPGRQRGKEAWVRSCEPMVLGYTGDWSPNRALISPAVRNGVQIKVNKARQRMERGQRYPEGTSLFIYVNITTFGNWEREISTAFIDDVAAAHPYFQSVWILWNDRFWRCYPNPFSGPPQSFRPMTHSLGNGRLTWESKRFFQEMLNE